jgi:predicted GIY-YIG superfamily endonuclease
VFRMYVLASDDGARTYVGVSKDISRRLRQHNGELKGGARSTRGRSWYVAAIVSNFSSDRAALAVEHVMHDQGKRWAPVSRGYGWSTPLERRITCLISTLKRVTLKRFGKGGPKLWFNQNWYLLPGSDRAP